MNKNINVCNNCGKTVHQFNQCKLQEKTVLDLLIL